MDQGKVDGQSVGALVGTIAEDEFSEDDRMSQGLFRIVVGWRHAVDVEESKKPVVFALGIQKSLAQIFGLGVLAWRFADAVKDAVKLRDFGLCLGKGNLAGVSEFSDLTGVRK